MRKAGWFALAAALALVAGILLLPWVIDWSRYRGEISGLVEAWTGRPFAVEGDIRLTLLPRPTLVAERVWLANPPHHPVPDMLAVDELRLQLAVWPLLRGELHALGVELVRPVLRLDRSEEGNANWRFEAGSGRPALRLDRVAVRGGILELRDGLTGRHVWITDVSGTVAAAPQRGGYEGSLTGSVPEAPFALDFNVPAAGSAGGAVWLSLRAPRSSLRLEFSGTVEGDWAGDFALAGRLAGSGADIAAGSGTIASLLGQNARIELHDPFTVAAQVTADSSSVALRELRLTIGESTADGELTADLRSRTAVGRLALAWIDLDRPGAAASGFGALPELVPDGFTTEIELRVGAIAWRGGVFRDTRAGLRLAGGEIEALDLQSELPGGAIARLSGAAERKNGAPRFDAAARITAANLRSTLAWLGLDVSGVPADRLRSAALSGDVTIAEGRLSVAGLDLQVDATRLQGGAAFALAGRPSFSASVVVDRINLDAYGGFDPAAWAPWLGEIDANLRARVEQLTVRQVPVHGLVVDAVLFQGALEIRQARLEEIAGGEARVLAALEGMGDEPRGWIAVEARLADGPRLFRLLGIPPGQAGMALAPLAVSAVLEPGPGAIAVTALRASVAGTPVSGSGNLRFGEGRPTLTASLEAGVLAPEQLIGMAVLAESADLNLHVDVAGEAFDLYGIRIEDPRFALAGQGQVVTLERFEGRIRDGLLAATGRLARADAGLEIKVAAELAGMAAGDALLGSSRIDIADAHLDLTVELAASGADPARAVQAMSGTAKLRFADGRLRGSGVPGRVLAFSELTGTFTVADGRAVSPDLRIVTADGAASGEARIDLRSGNLTVSLPMPAGPGRIRAEAPLLGQRRP